MKRYQLVSVALSLATLVGFTTPAYAHRLIEADGVVELQRGNAPWRRVYTGTKLKDGDLLKPAPGVKATVRCSNENSTLWSVIPGLLVGVRNGCGDSKTINPRSLDHLPGGNDPNVPYIVSPRNTFLLNDKPTFRWNSVSEATKYLVRVERQDALVWQTEVRSNRNEVVYGGEQPLEPGVTYVVTVEADNGTSSLDDEGVKNGEADKLGFVLLDTEEVQRVQEAVQKTIQSNLTDTDEAKALALAILYQEKQLRVDAIQTLKPLVAQGNKTAFVYQMLGDIYADKGLNLLAEAWYEKAIALATASENLDILTETKKNLAMVKMMLGKAADADQLLQQAQAKYEQLRDAESADQVAEELERLRNN